MGFCSTGTLYRSLLTKVIIFLEIVDSVIRELNESLYSFFVQLEDILLLPYEKGDK